MAKLRASGELSDGDVDDTEDILERNALLADFSDEEGDAEELRLGGVLENGNRPDNVRSSSIRSGHLRQESV
jgi:hypothetical protein